MTGNAVLSAYLGQLEDATARSDGNGVRELAEELAEAADASGGPAAIALHLEVVHRLARAALVGGDGAGQPVSGLAGEHVADVVGP
jgi:hypothetical protein